LNIGRNVVVASKSGLD